MFFRLFQASIHGPTPCFARNSSLALRLGPCWALCGHDGRTSATGISHEIPVVNHQFYEGLLYMFLYMFLYTHYTLNIIESYEIH